MILNRLIQTESAAVKFSIDPGANRAVGPETEEESVGPAASIPLNISEAGTSRTVMVKADEVTQVAVPPPPVIDEAPGNEDVPPFSTTCNDNVININLDSKTQYRHIRFLFQFNDPCMPCGGSQSQGPSNDDAKPPYFQGFFKYPPDGSDETSARVFFKGSITKNCGGPTELTPLGPQPNAPSTPGNKIKALPAPTKLQTTRSSPAIQQAPRAERLMPGPHLDVEGGTPVQKEVSQIVKTLVSNVDALEKASAVSVGPTPTFSGNEPARVVHENETEPLKRKSAKKLKDPEGPSLPSSQPKQSPPPAKVKSRKEMPGAPRVGKVRCIVAITRKLAFDWYTKPFTGQQTVEKVEEGPTMQPKRSQLRAAKVFPVEENNKATSQATPTASPAPVTPSPPICKIPTPIATPRTTPQTPTKIASVHDHTAITNPGKQAAPEHPTSCPVAKPTTVPAFSKHPSHCKVSAPPKIQPPAAEPLKTQAITRASVEPQPVVPVASATGVPIKSPETANVVGKPTAPPPKTPPMDPMLVEPQGSVPIPAESEKMSPAPVKPQPQAPVPVKPQPQAPAPAKPQEQPPLSVRRQEEAPVPVKLQEKDPVAVKPQEKAPVPVRPEQEAAVPVSPQQEARVPINPLKDAPVPTKNQQVVSAPLKPVRTASAKVKSPDTVPAPISQPETAPTNTKETKANTKVTTPRNDDIHLPTVPAHVVEVPHPTTSPPSPQRANSPRCSPPRVVQPETETKQGTSAEERKTDERQPAAVVPTAPVTKINAPPIREAKNVHPNVKVQKEFQSKPEPESPKSPPVQHPITEAMKLPQSETQEEAVSSVRSVSRIVPDARPSATHARTPTPKATAGRAAVPLQVETPTPADVMAVPPQQQLHTSGQEQLPVPIKAGKVEKKPEVHAVKPSHEPQIIVDLPNEHFPTIKPVPLAPHNSIVQLSNTPVVLSPNPAASAHHFVSPATEPQLPEVQKPELQNELSPLPSHSQTRIPIAETSQNTKRVDTQIRKGHANVVPTSTAKTPRVKSSIVPSAGKKPSTVRTTSKINTKEKPTELRADEVPELTMSTPKRVLPDLTEPVPAHPTSIDRTYPVEPLQVREQQPEIPPQKLIARAGSPELSSSDHHLTRSVVPSRAKAFIPTAEPAIETTSPVPIRTPPRKQANEGAAVPASQKPRSRQETPPPLTPVTLKVSPTVTAPGNQLPSPRLPTAPAISQRIKNPAACVNAVSTTQQTRTPTPLSIPPLRHNHAPKPLWVPCIPPEVCRTHKPGPSSRSSTEPGTSTATAGKFSLIAYTCCCIRMRLQKKNVLCNVFLRRA